jgi:hypothetical protein
MSCLDKSLERKKPMLVVCSLRKSKAHIFWLVESMEEGCGIPDITLIPSEVPWGYPLREQKGSRKARALIYPLTPTLRVLTVLRHIVLARFR